MPEIAVQQHFVTFFSPGPGTFVAEITTKPIQDWNVPLAQQIAAEVAERYGARPYAFQFFTEERAEGDLDSHQIATSPMYYLGGTVETLAQVEARATSRDAILLSNMRGNNYQRIITTLQGNVQPLADEDVVLS